LKQEVNVGKKERFEKAENLLKTGAKALFLKFEKKRLSLHTKKQAIFI